MDGDLQLCTYCNRPYTNTSAYRRHVSYCRKAQARPRKRQQACHHCSRAKARCNFGLRCTRCVDKDLNCTYGHRPKDLSTQSSDRSNGANVAATTPDAMNDVAYAPPAMDFELDQSLFAMLTPPAEENAISSLGRPGPLESDYVSLLNLERNLSVRLNVGTLERLQAQNPVSQQSMSMVLHGLRTFPKQMLRRDTLPFFIHPCWHLEDIPEPLAVCTRIAQMFSTRTKSIMPFIWRTIRAEQLRLAEEPDISLADLFAASQAQLVYIMMRVIDGSVKPTGYNQEMLVLASVICLRFIRACNGPPTRFANDERSTPCSTWDQWIHEESRRRTACAWFLMSQVLSLESGTPCDTTDFFRGLPLPSSKQRWKSDIPLFWEPYVEEEVAMPRTLGQLLETHRQYPDEKAAKWLDQWNANTDELGMLLNLTMPLL